MYCTKRRLLHCGGWGQFRQIVCLRSSSMPSVIRCSWNEFGKASALLSFVATPVADGRETTNCLVEFGNVVLALDSRPVDSVHPKSIRHLPLSRFGMIRPIRSIGASQCANFASRPSRSRLPLRNVGLYPKSILHHLTPYTNLAMTGAILAKWGFDLWKPSAHRKPLKELRTLYATITDSHLYNEQSDVTS